MKFICQTIEFKNAISNVHRAVPIRTTMSILEGIRIETNENQLILTGYDMEMGITCKIPAEILKTGSIVISAKMLSDIVRKAPDETISVEVEANDKVKIISGKSEFMINGRNDESYPVLPEVSKENELTLSQSILKNMIRQTIFSVSTDEQRRNLNGALLKSGGNHVEMVAIDGFRLAQRKEESVVELPELEFIIHHKTLRELMNILVDDEAAITMYTTQNHIKFNFGNVTMISRLISGTFMKYESLIPTAAQTTLIVNTIYLKRAIERAMLLIESDSIRFPMNLQTKENELLFVKEVTNAGEMHEEIEIEMTGDKLDIDFDPVYFSDALKVINEDQIKITFNGSVGPCLVTPVDGDKFAYLILPLRR